MGLAIPRIGLTMLGYGSLIGGLGYILVGTPCLLNSGKSIDSIIVPCPTLFTGMMFNNLYFLFSQIFEPRNIFGDILLNKPDETYPALVTYILPEVLYIILAAVIFESILSSFSGDLNAASTLLSLDFYKIFSKKIQQILKLLVFGN